MTRSARLAAVSALALVIVLNISIAGAQNVGDGQRALRVAPVGPVLSQTGGLRIPLFSAVQKVSLDDAGAAGASTASQPVSGGQKLAKVEVEGDAKATKLEASPASEQKPPVETKPNDAPAVVENVTKNVGLQSAAEAKPDRPVEPPRAPAERQPAAEAKVEQQPAVLDRAKEARAEAAPVNSAPSVDRARVAVQPAQEQAPTRPAFTPRHQRSIGFGGYGYAGYGRRPIHNRQCDN